jgi:hypothetical protein
VVITVRLVLELAVVLSAGVLLIGTCSQGRLKHAILWLLGAIPRERPTFSTRIPRAEHHWALVGRLSHDAPEEPPSVAS